MFDQKYIDYSRTNFKSFTITEDIYEQGKSKEYEYMCTYDLTIGFKNVKTDNAKFNRLTEEETFHDNGRLVKTFNERPELFQKMIAKEDDKEGTQDYAIRDWVDEHTKEPSAKFQILLSIFSEDVPKRIFERAYSGNYDLEKGDRKLSSLEFDYRKPSISTMTVVFDDGKSFIVELKHPVTNDDVDAVVPDMTLPELYTNVDDWLKEDYESTLDILKEIFKFDFETLKGASVK